MKTEIEGGYIFSDQTGNGSPLFLIHGYPLSRKIWDPQVSNFEKIASIVRIDLRGHGDSFDFDGPYPMDLLADDCKLILDAHQVDSPLVIGGLSMGGYVTFALYRKYPDLFKGMILISTRAGADSEEGKKNRDASIKVVLEKGPKAIADGMIQKIVSPAAISSNPQLMEKIRAIMETTSILGIVGALQGMRDRPVSTSMLSTIKCPVLIIHGEDDQLIPIKDAEAMHEQIPGSQLVKIPNAGHLLNMEQPELFNQAVSKFLSGLN